MDLSPAGDADRAARAPVLIVLHQETSSPGRVADALRRLGFPLDIRRPRYGDPLPDTMAEHAGAIVFGGPMSANDPDDFVKREIDWLAVPLKEEKPYLGICLGAQMLAKHLGASVGPHHAGMAEIGYYALRPTPAGTSLLDWPPHVYQWHREGFDVPRGADLLASGDLFPNQAIRVGSRAYGIQFHPELTWAMMNRWCVRAADRMLMPGAQPRTDHFRGRHMHDAPIRAWLDRFLAIWLADDPARSLSR
ncbi:glutamine amidotransferase [Chthonobacter rhizosphaerae]|uniref:glutamine amidotransferase n=1 Tax=Chthonobacter rhizosphaerae TaxID=2735553 RepID=UPI0015EF4E69|nr:glutamine amidotransferase [Chthonobacter rhizosphaerae]